jgi:hypothetical protein
MITEILTILQKDDYFGCGEFIEIAKGKNQYITTLKIGGRKIKRAWLYARK